MEDAMMKKQYVNPEIKVIVINQTQSMMQGSPNGTNVHTDKNADNSEALSRQNTFDLWAEEEFE